MPETIVPRPEFVLKRDITSPLCPSDVQGSVGITKSKSPFRKALSFFGPALLIAVGYMDPGNWATDIEAGSKFGFNLLFVVLLSSVAAIGLQCLSLRVGIASGQDLAQLSRAQYAKKTNFALWLLAEVAIIACDLAEVLGSALALHLLLGVSISAGILITGCDTVLILGLKNRGFRQIEAVILALVLIISGCFLAELILVKPFWPDVIRGFMPRLMELRSENSLYLTIGILGATIMPHNLYLHSSIVQSRQTDFSDASKKTAISYASLDTVVSLGLAFFVNAAILILASSAFHANGHAGVADIEDAYHLLDPVIGSGGVASFLFGLALLASGQSSTFTGTIAGQVIMEGYLRLKIACWKRRVITRALALIPALIGVALMGHHAVGRLLVLSQVVLSLQLPFAIYPLITFAGRKSVMGIFAIPLWAKLGSWALFFVIAAANLWLIERVFVG